MKWKDVKKDAEQLIEIIKLYEKVDLKKEELK